jgi:hypothetical protein
MAVERRGPAVCTDSNKKEGKGGSSRQSCESGEVRVLVPPVACVGRLAYPMRAKVTTHVLLGRKRLSCPATIVAAVGTIWEASKLGGLNVTK